MRNYLTGKERLLVAALAFILPFSFAKAEAREDGKTGQQGWYVGVEGGMPFGFSTFSSFGHDKTHPGWAAGLYGGYRFNSIFSAELSAKYGEMNLSAQDCCVERNYWLGSDGVPLQGRCPGHGQLGICQSEKPCLYGTIWSQSKYQPPWVVPSNS